MVHITEIAFTGYPVTDIARARSFYEGVLNLKLTMQFEHEGKQWIEYDIGSSTLAVTNLDEKWKSTSDGPSVALEVKDFEQAVATLRQNKVKFLYEPMENAGCRMAIVADPDGNSLTIHQRKAR